MTAAGWGTWSADRPVELVHLGSGLTLTPVLYSARANAVSRIGMGPGLVLGERPIGGGGAAFTTRHEDTDIDWRYRFEDADRLEIDWSTRSNGEWGLRFWVALCVSGGGFDLVYDDRTGALAASDGTRSFDIVPAKKPLLVTVHDDLDALEAEFREHGYFYLASRGREGRFVALRFNLEEGPAMRIVVAPSSGEPPVRPALPDGPIAIVPQRPGDDAGRPLAAVHDVMAWNHVFDRINGRPYTVLTRFWNTAKFGGFGVWMNDIVYNAWLWSLFDGTAARDNLEAVFAWQTEDGNFPCLITGNDRWLDRSQPPIVSFAVWSIAARLGDRGLLERAWPALKRNHDWWWRRRSAGDLGLVVYGTSLDAGDGLYKGTKLAAKDESSMDNMAVHDPAPFDEETGLLMSYDVALNSMLALDAECLALIADGLGLDSDAADLRASGTAHREAIQTHLWDDTRGVFANRLVDSGFVEPLAPTSFYPMAAGAATPEQVDSLVDNYLLAPDRFGGVPGLPSATRDDPAYRDNVYWRGRIWAPLNFWTWIGLLRAGREAEADALCAMGWRLFDAGWRERQCGENYNAETGAILDQADTDPFYSWGALLAAMPVAAAVNLTPWHGLGLARPDGSGPMGPVRSPLGEITLEAPGDVLRVGDAAGALVETTLPRLRHVTWSDGCFRAELPAGGAAWLRLPRGAG
ncbi:trehalase family glycosidase, partial [Microbaculum marinum]